MITKARMAILFLLFAIMVGAGLWILRPRDPVFHGKRESEWIKSISYRGDDAQTEQWRALGPDGLHLLAKTLDRGRRYRKIYRWMMPRLPGALSRVLYGRLPEPADLHPTRMCVISLLSSLGKDAKAVEPAIARTLSDDDNGVRLSALGCYGLHGFLEVIGDKAKAARLPEFIRAMRDPEWAIRNNAVLALGFYPDQARVVVPILVKALGDSNIEVRLLATEGLVHVDIQSGLRAGILPILVTILKDPNDQVAYQAAELLGELGKESAPAVPAMIESIHGTNGLVAQTAARALKKIDPEAAVKAGVK